MFILKRVVKYFSRATSPGTTGKPVVKGNFLQIIMINNGLNHDCQPLKRIKVG